MFFSKKIKARRYIDISLGVDGFFKAINDLGIDYVVLRWFEGLPKIEPGEDIDMLVADDALEVLSPYLSGVKGSGIPCDVYSVTGLGGATFRGLPYYPPAIAEKILEEHIVFKNGIRVPSKKNHFLSMCYHALYHKGYRSGVPSKIRLEQYDNPEHDYVYIIDELSRAASIEVSDLTLEGLDDLLGRLGWRPQRDTLAKLSIKNLWVADYLDHTCVQVPLHYEGVTAFIVREEALSFFADIQNILFSEGFDVLRAVHIEPDMRGPVSQKIRGGVWGAGPWPKSGGLPALFLLVNDLYPIRPAEELLTKHPGLSNERILAAKEKVRDFVNAKYPENQRFNALHSADNAAQAMDYADAVDLGLWKSVGQELASAQEKFKTPFEVVESLSRYSKRAKVEKVLYEGGLAVCKTYRPGRERFLLRELKARSLGCDIPEVSRVIHSSESFMVLEYVEGVPFSDARSGFFSFFPVFLPLSVLLRLRDIILLFRSRGYDCVDFSPNNVICGTDGKVVLIDFEFFQVAGTLSENLRDCAAWFTVNRGGDFELPNLVYKKGPYFDRWLKFTGVPVSMLLWRSSTVSMHFVRALFFIYLFIDSCAHYLLKLSRLGVRLIKRIIKKLVR